MSDMLQSEGFHYQALSDPSNDIRLLEIIGEIEADTDSINCELAIWPVKSTPSYHAISYTWGDTDTTKSVIINGKKVSVGKNCYNALSQAHSSGLSGNRFFWIDSICINQDDIPEKSQQVAIMSTIYRNADHVLACVGESADDSSFLCEFLRKHATKLNRCSKKWRVDDSADNIFQQRHIHRTLGLNSPARRRILAAYMAFIDRRYFTRVWIMQELFMGRNISVCCGSDVIPMQTLDGFRVVVCQIASRDLNPGLWGDFKSVVQVFQPTRKSKVNSHLSQILRSDNFVRNHMEVATHENTELLPLGQAASMTSGLDCKDPRDKVYALSALIDWGKVAPIRPDYSIQLFDLAVHVLRKLAELELNDGSPEFYDPRMELIPSLGLTTQTNEVADALCRRRSPNHSTAGATGDSNEQVSFLKKRSMFWLAWRIIYDDEYRWRLECNKPIPLDPSFDKSVRHKTPPEIHVRVKDTQASVYLPSYVHPGDYLIIQGRFTASLGSKNWLGMVARPEAGLSRCPIVGKAIVEGDLGSDAICTSVGALGGYVFFDPKDLIVHTAAEQQYPSWQEVGKQDREVYLRTRVCETPGSSYGIVESLYSLHKLVAAEKKRLLEFVQGDISSETVNKTAPAGDETVTG
ncbi:hypothetical protein EsH8_VI_000877 [Colletotrichum jinshuiense]